MPADEKPLLKSNKKQNYGTTATSQTSISEGPSDINSINTLPETDISTNVPDDGPLPPDQMKSTLSFLQKSGFGLGHIYNDLCAGLINHTLL